MNSRLKLLGKSIIKGINAAVGTILPMADARGRGITKGIETKQLAEPVTIKGSIESYDYNTKSNPPYWIELFNQGVSVSGVYYMALRGAAMVGRGVIIYQKKVLLESAIFQREYLNKLLVNHKIISALFKKPTKQFGKAIPLLNKLSNNYYHWTTESLTRLAAFIEYSGENYHDYDIIIAADAPSFVRESLIALFGIQPAKIIQWRNTDCGTLDKCVLISYPFIRTQQTAMTNIYNLPLYNLLNKISLKNLPSPNQAPTYIIISRANVNQRKLVGEDKLKEYFAHIPFQIIHTEKMGYVEQVYMFRNAKLVIAPHGAGLINLVYVTNKPLVIELFPTIRKIRDAGAYHQVAREMNIDYHLLVKEPVNNDQDIEITEGILTEIKDILFRYGY